MIGGKLLISPSPSGLTGSSPSPDPLSTSVGFAVGVTDKVVGSTGSSVLTVVCTEGGEGERRRRRGRRKGGGGEDKWGERGEREGEIVNYTKLWLRAHIYTQHKKRYVNISR